MSTRKQMIGYNRTVRLQWLEETAQMLAMGQPETQIINTLRQRLKDQLSVGSSPKRGSREKTITLLVKTWVRVTHGLEGFRDDGIRFLQQMPADQHLPLHWGMTMAAYPFWRVVAETAGRLLGLQGTTSTDEIQRRVKEQFGQRETVKRSARYVVRAFVDWGVLVETDRTGTYRMNTPCDIPDGKLRAWLLEAQLRARENGVIELHEAINTPALFPFRLLQTDTTDVARNPRLEITVHGHDRPLIALARERRG
jgi:hypothetical protein